MKVAFISIIILIVTISINLWKKDLWDANAELLKEEVSELNVDTIHLEDITPFEWDVVYSFNPYTSKEEIYKTIGYKWDRISETVSEGMNQIVFLKDGKVVCYLYGYPTNNGYGINFIKGNYTDVTTVLTPEDDLNFKVTISDGVTYLSIE
ncbi:hypothetical protein ACNQFZ_00240 [Schinkia sp. CFF1]